jgi:hypothetical protein
MGGFCHALEAFASLSLFACLASAAPLPGSMPAHRSDAADYLAYSGTASSLRGSSFLYGEKHVLRLRDGRVTDRVVLYTCKDGSPFARKTVSYVEPFAPDFTLEDASNGMREGIRSSADGREVFFRGDGSAPEKTGALPQSPALVADAGFDEFVRAHWKSLVSGKPAGMDFVIPSRLDDLSFKVRHVGRDQTDGVPVEVFRLKLAGVLGWVLPGIDVSYSDADHTLTHYVGLSDLRDADNDNFKAEIDFPPAERRPATAEEFDAAHHARLTACR